MCLEFKDLVNYSYPYEFLKFTKSLSRSLETNPNVSFLSWVIRQPDWSSCKQFFCQKDLNMVRVSRMASCNLRNFGPCLSLFREIRHFQGNVTDLVNYNKPLRYICSTQYVS